MPAFALWSGELVMGGRSRVLGSWIIAISLMVLALSLLPSRSV